MRTICWDIEIRTSPNECVDGWEGARRGECGVSCVALFDSYSGRMHVYDEHDLERCVAHLNGADLLVGFNTIEFDTPALTGVTGEDILPDQYDILHEIWKALGTRVKGYKLDDICQRAGLGAKNSNGEFATVLYKKQHFGRLFDYCMNDVHLTRKLSNHIAREGSIPGPDGALLYLPSPGVEV